MVRRKHSSKSEPRKRRAATLRFLRHRNLIAAEAVLLIGLVKDWLTGAVRDSDLPNYGKVLFVMGATLGILGGLYFVVERLLAHGVARTHSVVGALPLPIPTLAAHALVLGILFLVYARHLGMPVL